MNLIEIENKMKQLVEELDFEVAHKEGDELLIELLKILSRNHEKQDVIRRIIKYYEDMGKWYA